MIRHIPSLLLGLLLAACAAPAPNGHAPAAATPETQASVAAQTPPAPPSDDGEYPRPKPPLPSRDPLPPGQTPVAVDYSCKADADCAVKNVGNCCGYYPACVNTRSPTDPQGVQAECARKGMMSVCGFPEISSCTCKQGRCEAASGDVQVQ
jgi:hypothetical protein